MIKKYQTKIIINCGGFAEIPEDIDEQEVKKYVAKVIKEKLEYFIEEVYIINHKNIEIVIYDNPKQGW